MAIFLVVHRSRFDPWRHDDRGYPVPGAIEGEAAFADGRRWVRRGDSARRDVVVGASRLVPADQEGGVPDVGACLRRGGAVGGEHPLQEGLTGSIDDGVSAAMSTWSENERPKAGW